MTSEIEAIARVLIKEARRGRGKEPVFRILRGWKFGLSYGPIPLAEREVVDHFKGSIGQRLGVPEFGAASYEQIAGARRAMEVLHTHDHQWILSASLHPRGRSSTDADWELLGQVIKAMGAPPGSLRTPFETTPPSAVHYWMWTDPEAPQSS